MAKLSYAQVKQYAANAGFTGSGLNTITAISYAESSGRTDAINRNSNGTVDYGLTQINSIHGYGTAAYDPQTAMDAAYKISNGGTNFRPWTVYKTGDYLKHIDAATAANVSETSGSSGSFNGLPSVPDYSGQFAPSQYPTMLAPGSADGFGTGRISVNGSPQISSDALDGSGFGTGLTREDFTNRSGLSVGNPFRESSQSSVDGFGVGTVIPNGSAAVDLGLSSDIQRMTDPSAANTSGLNSGIPGLDASATSALGGAATTNNTWSEFFAVIGGFVQRGFVVILGIVLIFVGLWAMNNGRPIQLVKGKA